MGSLIWNIITSENLAHICFRSATASPSKISGFSSHLYGCKAPNSCDASYYRPRYLVQTAVRKCAPPDSVIGNSTQISGNCGVDPANGGVQQMNSNELQNPAHLLAGKLPSGRASGRLRNDRCSGNGMVIIFSHWSRSVRPLQCRCHPQVIQETQYG